MNIDGAATTRLGLHRGSNLGTGWLAANHHCTHHHAPVGVREMTCVDRWFLSTLILLDRSAQCDTNPMLAKENEGR